MDSVEGTKVLGHGELQAPGQASDLTFSFLKWRASLHCRTVRTTDGRRELRKEKADPSPTDTYTSLYICQ